jgi:CRISPR/Cas system-associated endoribonuclease Cas2
MGKITHENDQKFVAAEADIVRICSTNWVQKSAYENLIKRTQLNEVIIYRLHVRPSLRP